MPPGKFASTGSQKHYPDLCSDASSVRNFGARFCSASVHWVYLVLAIPMLRNKETEIEIEVHVLDQLVRLTLLRNWNNGLNSKNRFFWLSMHGNESRNLPLVVFWCNYLIIHCY